jgi:hypothetical protein
MVSFIEILAYYKASMKLLLSGLPFRLVINESAE